MSRRRSVLAIGALAVGTFAIGTTEFVIAGLLPEVAASFGVSISRAGLLVSAYALGVVIGAPLVTGAVASLPRKPVLVGLLSLFVVGNGISALATTFPLMMTGRVVASLCHGAFIGVASVVAAGLVSPARQARAIAGLLTGLTLANVVGVPMGTLLGQHFGWRATFWTVASLGLLAMLAIAVLVPRTGAAEHVRVRAQLSAFRRPQVWLALAMTALGFGAVYAPFTYITPLMTDVAGYPPSAMTWLLVLFGCGLVGGNVLGARAADRRLMTTIIVSLVVLTGVLTAFSWTARSAVPAVLTLVLLGVVAYATVPAFTSRVLSCADEAGGNAMASSAAVAAFNLGNATGAYLGGAAISAGRGYTATPLVGAAMAALATLIAGAAAALQHHTVRRRGVEHRRRPAPAAPSA